MGLGTKAFRPLWKTYRISLRYPQPMGYTCAVHTHRQGTAKIGPEWVDSLWEAFAGDPEWERFASALSPTMPLRDALTMFVSQLKAWVDASDEEARDAHTLLERIETGGFDDPEAFFAALEAGNVSAPSRIGRAPRRRAVKSEQGAA